MLPTSRQTPNPGGNFSCKVLRLLTSFQTSPMPGVGERDEGPDDRGDSEPMRGPPSAPRPSRRASRPATPSPPAGYSSASDTGSKEISWGKGEAGRDKQICCGPQNGNRIAGLADSLPLFFRRFSGPYLIRSVVEPWNGVHSSVRHFGECGQQ